MKRILHLIVTVLACLTAVAAQSGSVCPVISVTGPQGATAKGDLAEFTATISGESPKDLKYFWMVSAGQIRKGQGTLSIKVSQASRGENLTATLRVAGLPKDCLNYASETAPIIDYPEAILLDDFPAPVSRIDKIRLKAAAGELAQNPTSSLLIFEYFLPETSKFARREAVHQISKFLIREIKMSERDFTIVTADGDDNSTKIYRIPPGSLEPIP